VRDDMETIDDIVLSQFIPEVDDDPEESIMVETPLVSINDAISALERLRLYEEQQDQGDSQFISVLHKHERLMQARKLNTQKQADIRSFFG